MSKGDKSKNGRILALDIGEVRTGVALSCANGQHASPFQVLDTKQLCSNNKELHTIVADYEVDTVVVGLPLQDGGSEGSQARRTRNLAQKMLTGMDVLNIIFFDERQSSKIAKSAGHSMGLSEKDMRGKLDSHAAAAFLQSYLDTIEG